MALFNFKHQFHPYILDGTKPGTIRRIRKHPVKPGDMLQLYPPRFTKPYTLIMPPQVCTDVKTIFMLPNGAVFLINSMMEEPDTWRLLADDAALLKLQFEADALTTEQKDQLAWNDGFRFTGDPDRLHEAWHIMRHWWMANHQLDTTPFAGHYIFWK